MQLCAVLATPKPLVPVTLSVKQLQFNHIVDQVHIFKIHIIRQCLGYSIVRKIHYHDSNVVHRTSIVCLQNYTFRSVMGLMQTLLNEPACLFVGEGIPQTVGG